MTSEKTADTNPERAGENACGQTSEKLPFEIPQCCRQMMTQMMGGSFCGPGKGRDEQSTQNSSDSPGTFGRLMLRMMKACCSRVAAKQNRAV
jgi:hypothetical protein